jgi:hypothetical protein
MYLTCEPAIFGIISGALAAGPDNAGYRGLGPRFCSQRYCNSLTGTSDDRPRSQAAVNQPTRNSAPPSTGSATPVMKLASTHARGFSSPLVGPRSRFLASSRWTCSRFLVSSCRPSRFLVSSCRLLTVPRVFLASSCRIDTLDVSNFLLFRRSRNSRASQRGSSSPLVGPHSRFLVSSRRTTLGISRLLSLNLLAISRLLLSTCSRFLVSSCRPARGFSSPLVDYSRFPGSSSPRAVESIHSTSRISPIPPSSKFEGKSTRFLVSSRRTHSRFPGSSSPRAVESIHSTSRISSYSAELEI